MPYAVFTFRPGRIRRRPGPGSRFSWAVAALSFALCGCTTPRPEIPPKLEEEAPSLPPERAAAAEAMARFSLGLMDQIHGDMDAALTNYAAAIALDPDNDELYLRIAMGHLRQRKPEEAIAVLEALAQRRPRSDQPLLWLALVYRALDRPQDAAAAYQRAIRVAPSRAAAYLELASLQVREGREDEAVRLLETALGKVEDPKELLRLLGQLYIRKANASPAEPGEAKNRKAAIEALEKVARQEPDDITTLYQLGDLYILDHQIEKAIASFERIERLQPDNLQVKKKLALSFAVSGNQEKAIEALEQIARKQPENRYVFYYLGELYEKLGDKDKAILNYRLAAKAGPPEPAPYIKLSLLMMEADPEGAVRALREGLEAMPGNPRLSEMLAYVFMNQKNYKEAVAQFVHTEHVLVQQGASPMTPFFYFNFAVAAQHAGDLEKAATCLGRAMEINSAFLDTFIQYVIQEDREVATGEALQILEKLSAQSPDEPALRVYAGLLHSYGRSYDKAIAAFEEAEAAVARARPESAAIELDANFYFWYAAACERSGQLERAEALFRKCLQLDPRHAEAYNYLAYMWAEKGVRLDEATEFITKALEINPENGAFIDTLGWIYYMQGRHEEALAQIQRASQLVPDDPTILDHLGDIHHKLGDDAKALQAWEQSFLLDPDNENVASKLQARGADVEELRARGREQRAQREAEKAAAREKKAKPLVIVPPEGDEEAQPPPEEPAPLPLPIPSDLAPIE